MASLREVSTAMHGALLLAKLDRAGMAYFDRTESGFWQSFTAALLVYPIFLVLGLVRIDEQSWASAGALRILVVETIGYVIGWVAFPLVMLPLCRRLHRDRRWMDFIIVFNWSQVPQAVLILIAAGLASGAMLSEPVGIGLLRAAFVATLLYEWFIARIALDVGGGPATLIVAIDVVLHEIVGTISRLLY